MNSYNIFPGRIAICVIAYGWLTVVNAYGSRPEDNWTREPFLDATAGDTTSPFTLLTISSINNHLIGDCAYVNKSSKSHILVNVSESSIGEFWPQVILEVADNIAAKWQAIGKSSLKGKKVDLPIKPKDTDTVLYVNLDGFRPFIGKKRFGRLVLNNGDACVFALKWLLPPSSDSNEQK